MILELGSLHRFDVTYRALVMGILNRTPDSFFDRGTYFGLDEFLRKADTLVAQGADLLDVGGVTRSPGTGVVLGGPAPAAWGVLRERNVDELSSST